MKLKLMLEVLAIGVVLSVAAPAQLNGSYTVGPAGTYATMTAAVADLTTQGVSGPVNFLVTGSHTGPITIGAIPNQGAANPVTFLGGGVATLTIASGAVLTLSGCEYVAIDGFTGSFTTGPVIVIAGSNNTFRNCTFTLPVGSGSSNTVFDINSGTGITIEDCTFGGGYEAFNSATACDQLTFQRNRIEAGSFWTAQVNGTNVTVRNNFFYGVANYGLRAGAGTNNLRILNNSFYMVHPTSSSQYCALRWYGTAADYSEVINNCFYDSHPATTGGFVMWCSGALKPSVMDYNTFYLINGLALIYSGANLTLAAWQTTYGRDLNSSEGVDPGYANIASTPPDLHISAGSPNFMSGTPTPYVTDDIDMQPRNPSVPSRGADELPLTGIYANFTASPQTGPAALTVNFTDTTFTSDPGGVILWAWDLDGDGLTDSTTQNPSFTYATPGVYGVSLTATDVLNGSNTISKPNYITVGPYDLTVATTPGMFDLTITPIPHVGAPNAATGYLLFTFATTLPVNTGPLFGIVPDFNTWTILLSQPQVGNILHWAYVPGLFPDVPLVLPPGSVAFLAGLTVDFVQIDLTAALGIASTSNVARISL